jgi:hypothetical protein
MSVAYPEYQLSSSSSSKPTPENKRNCKVMAKRLPFALVTLHQDLTFAYQKVNYVILNFSPRFIDMTATMASCIRHSHTFLSCHLTVAISTANQSTFTAPQSAPTVHACIFTCRRHLRHCLLSHAPVGMWFVRLGGGLSPGANHLPVPGIVHSTCSIQRVNEGVDVFLQEGHSVKGWSRGGSLTCVLRVVFSPCQEEYMSIRRDLLRTS